jgi:DNA processing protein
MPPSSPDTPLYKDIVRLSSDTIPLKLRQIPDAPSSLNLRGSLPPEGYALLSVVGSRKHTAYGKDVVGTLISGLRGYPVAIISGLALGIDGLAHRAALEAGLPTLAVPGSGLNWDVLYPQSHKKLAEEILRAGGGIISELPNDASAAPWTFPKRNRIMAGLSDAVLIVEAQELSGTLITARLAMEYNRDVLAVPGPITAIGSRGPNALIRDGASPILAPTDILDALGIPVRDITQDNPMMMEGLTETERKALFSLTIPLERDAFFEVIGTTPEHGNVILLELEMRGLIRTHGGLVMKA